MLLFWRIRYLDSRDRAFKDRDLWLDTQVLDHVSRARVELDLELGETDGHRNMLRHRHLFTEKERPPTSVPDRFSGFLVSCYFEDENGLPLSQHRMGVILSGTPHALVVPAGADNHDIAFVTTETPPLPIDEMTLSESDIKALIYFTRDLRELLATSFAKEESLPVRLSCRGGTSWRLETAVSDEELRSFAMVLRRLYMKSEVGSLANAVDVTTKVLTNHLLGLWIRSSFTRYEQEVTEAPFWCPVFGVDGCPVSRKTLIDVFLNTIGAHQPNHRRTREYEECLRAADNSDSKLMFMFIESLWTACVHYRSIGTSISEVFDAYCARHRPSIEYIKALSGHLPEFGTLEKKTERAERILAVKAQELAQTIWDDKGRPAGGPAQYVAEARELLDAP